MAKQVEVVFEGGVLRPVGQLPVRLREKQHLTVTIDDEAGDHSWLAAADPTVSLEDVRRALAKASGSLADVVAAEREER